MRKTTAYARKRSHQDAWQRARHEACNPVTEAVVRQRIEGDIQRLRTEAGLQTYMGGDAARIANMAGRLVYVVCHAAGTTAWARHQRRGFWLARQTRWPNWLNRPHRWKGNAARLSAALPPLTD